MLFYVFSSTRHYTCIHASWQPNNDLVLTRSWNWLHKHMMSWMQEQTFHRHWGSGWPDILNRSRKSLELYTRMSYRVLMFCPKKFKLSQKVKTLKFPTRDLKKLQTVTGGRHRRCWQTHNLSRSMLRRLNSYLVEVSLSQDKPFTGDSVKIKQLDNGKQSLKCMKSWHRIDAKVSLY